MKRKMVLGLIALGTASMLCGFDSAETADSVLQKMYENSAAIENTAMDMTMNCDIAINIGDGTTTSTISYLITGDFDIAEIMSPLAMEMTGSINISGLGQSETVDMQMYEVTGEDGSLEMYTYTMDSTTGEDGTWEYSVIDSEETSALTEQLKSADISSLSDYGIYFELAPEAADVDGTECYLLSSTLDSSTFSAILGKLSELTGEDLTADSDVSEILSLLSGVKIKIEYYVDTASYLPVKIHVDLNESDFSALNGYAASYLGTSDADSTTTVEIVVNDLSVDMTGSYGTVTEITVPEEALAAIAAQDTTEDAAEAATEEAAEAATEEAPATMNAAEISTGTAMG